jgi:hypothetical protein
MSWSPDEITTTLWLDGSDSTTITLDGSGNVEQWDDKSGNINHATQASASNRPGYSTDVLTFTGTTFLQVTPINITGEHFIIIVFTPTSTFTSSLANQYIISALSGGVYSFICGGNVTGAVAGETLTWGVISGGYFGKKYETNVSNEHIFSFSYDGDSTVDIRQDSVSLTIADFNANFSLTKQPTQYTYIGTFVDGTAGLQGSINEIIILPTEPSESDRQKLEGYLAHKWDLEASLPADHPYKEAAPVGTPDISETISITDSWNLVPATQELSGASLSVTDSWNLVSANAQIPTTSIEVSDSWNLISATKEIENTSIEVSDSWNLVSATKEVPSASIAIGGTFSIARYVFELTIPETTIEMGDSWHISSIEKEIPSTSIQFNDIWNIATYRSSMEDQILGFIQTFHRNILENSTVVSSPSADSSFPIYRLYDRKVGRNYKPASLSTTILVIDQGASTQYEIDTIIIPKNHNLADTSLVLQYSDDGVSYITALSWLQLTSSDIRYSFTEQTKRYWRFSITGASTLPYLAELFLTKRYIWGRNPIELDRGNFPVFNVVRLEDSGGRPRFLELGDRKEIRTYSLEMISGTHRTAIVELNDAWAGKNPFYLIDVDGTTLLYVEITSPLEFRRSGDYASCDFNIMEVLP